MRSKLIIAFFMILVSFFAKAEKTYRQDHTTCTFKDELIDVDLRSHQQYSSSADSEYGETIVIAHSGKTKTIQLADAGMGRYRMVKAENQHCHKILVLPVKDDELAIFLLRDNRPFNDNLHVLYYNLKTQEDEVVPSKIQTKNALFLDGKAFFRLASDHDTQKFGKVTIKDQSYNYVEKNFEPWISFDGRNFRLDREMTYQQFEHKNLISMDMLTALNEFKEMRYKVAMNPLSKKNCISLDGGNWVCQ